MSLPKALKSRTVGIFSARSQTWDATDSAGCRRVLLVYLAGYFLMYVHWMQLAWLVAGVFWIRRGVDWGGLWKSMKRDAVVLSFALFLGWMTLRSLVATGTASWTVMSDAMAALGGVLWLAAFAALAWQAAGSLRALNAAGAWVGAAAALAAVVSFLMFYFVLPGHFIGERLANWFVFGGLNPVCTGLTFGFAAMWIVCVKERRKEKHGLLPLFLVQAVLIVAVLFTRSRGALLALVVGHVALTLACGWKKTSWDWLVLASMILIFQVSGPSLRALALAQAKDRAEKSSAAAVFGVSAGNPLSPEMTNPMRELLTRADSGRLEIYRAGIGALPDAAAWLFGIGQWGTDECWRSKLSASDPPPPHLHSAILATLVQGGLIGLGLLMVPLVLGFRRGWQLAETGHPTWWTLLAFGCAGLPFDGQSLTRMNTLPLFEPLLIVFPLVVAAGGWAHWRDENQGAG